MAQGEKIQKVLARAGYGSRREIERWIQDGVISVNGNPATMGDRITGEEMIRISGQRIKSEKLETKETQVLLYHKPTGQVCTRKDPEGRQTIFDKLPEPAHGRWVVVGRLDINTSGLLLLTNDGELANRLMHPSNEVEREYSVRILGEVTEEMIKTLQKGVVLEDGPAKFDKVISKGGDGANQWYNVTLKEGKYREVRRLWESQGVQVSRLIRIRYGHVQLPRNLSRGQTKLLPAVQIGKLKESVGLKVSLTEKESLKRHAQQKDNQKQRKRRTSSQRR